MPSINEQYDSAAAAEVRAIFRKSDELRNLLENELQRLEKNETFAANEFQQGCSSRTDRLISHGQRAGEYSNSANIGYWHKGRGPRRSSVFR